MNKPSLKQEARQTAGSIPALRWVPRGQALGAKDKPAFHPASRHCPRVEPSIPCGHHQARSRPSHLLGPRAPQTAPQQKHRPSESSLCAPPTVHVGGAGPQPCVHTATCSLCVPTHTLCCPIKLNSQHTSSRLNDEQIEESKGRALR